MKLIPLSQTNSCPNNLLKYFAQIDDEDYEKINKYTWQVKIKKNTCYARSYINGSLTSMHRMIMNISDPKIIIDHKDRNGLNNQKSNLRKCTDYQNRLNSKWGHGTSKYKGVHILNDCKAIKYGASIQIKKQIIRLGRFNSEIEAAMAYNEAAKIYFGEFAYINPIP